MVLVLPKGRSRVLLGVICVAAFLTLAFIGLFELRSSGFGERRATGAQICEDSGLFVSGTSGKRFSGVSFRRFEGKKFSGGRIPRVKRVAVPLKDLSIPQLSCKNWIVVTSIFAPSEATRKMASLKNWCFVIVTDKKSPLEYDVGSSERFVYLTVEMQEKLSPYVSFVEMLPWNHFGRKMLGFWFAMLCGAEKIYDTDDDNIPSMDDIPMLPENAAEAEQVFVPLVNSSLVYNPYPFFGRSRAWPRGFPYPSVLHRGSGYEATGVPLVPSSEKNVRYSIQQAVADVAPDLDAVYRLTVEWGFSFVSPKGVNAIAYPAGLFVPWNAQATVFYRDAFWAMLLPVTVHGRVSDIWRSYIAEPIMWRAGQRLLFCPAWVWQDRNEHDLIADLQSEVPLYTQADRLVEVLSAKIPESSVPAAFEWVYVNLYERGFIEKKDVLLAQAWLVGLLQIGYEFPPFV